MRTLLGAVTVASLLLAGCGFTSPVPARNLACPDDTPRGACEAVANLAIGRMNLNAIGPIDTVIVESSDCRRMAAAYFRSELGTAKHCWAVQIQGDGSTGGAFVWERADGILQADLAS